MASFMSSVIAPYHAFGVALLEAKDKDPNLDLDEFMKTFFGAPISIEAKVTQKKAEKPREFGKKREPPKNACTATTAKGTQCTKCAVKGGPFCTIHLKKNDGAVTKTKPKKEAKVVPVHTHKPGEKKECSLCDTHGDVTNDEEEKFEVGSEHADPDPDFVLEEEEFDD